MRRLYQLRLVNLALFQEQLLGRKLFPVALQSLDAVVGRSDQLDLHLTRLIENVRFALRQVLFPPELIE